MRQSERESAGVGQRGDAARHPDGAADAGAVRRRGASDELCLLVVMNTASLQLIPSTVAAVRAQLGAAHAFDILPAVWLASACSVGAGILAAKGLKRCWRT